MAIENNPLSSPQNTDLIAPENLNYAASVDLSPDDGIRINVLDLGQVTEYELIQLSSNLYAWQEGDQLVSPVFNLWGNPILTASTNNGMNSEIYLETDSGEALIFHSAGVLVEALLDKDTTSDDYARQALVETADIFGITNQIASALNPKPEAKKKFLQESVDRDLKAIRAERKRDHENEIAEYKAALARNKEVASFALLVGINQTIISGAKAIANTIKNPSQFFQNTIQYMRGAAHNVTSSIQTVINWFKKP